MSSRLTPTYQDHLLLLLVLLVLAAVSGCESETVSEVKSEFTVFVSIPPQLEIIRQLGGKDIVCQSIIRPGQSPATYDPTPRQMAQLAEADICFLIGVPFEERFIKRAGSVLKSVKMIKSQAGLPLRRLKHHDQHPGDGHTDNGFDPHLWLSPRLMKGLAENMAQGLVRIDSSNSENITAGLEKLTHRLDSLETEIRNILAEFAGDTIYVFHPSYGYFTDAFGLTQVALEPEGKEADAAYMARLMKLLKSRKVSGIFVQPQFSDHLARNVASEIGTKLIILDPLRENYFENMIEIAHQLANVLSSETRSLDQNSESGS